MESSDLYGMSNHAHAFHIKQLNREYIMLDTIVLNRIELILRIFKIQVLYVYNSVWLQSAKTNLHMHRHIKILQYIPAMDQISYGQPLRNVNYLDLNKDIMLWTPSSWKWYVQRHKEYNFFFFFWKEHKEYSLRYNFI